MQQFDPHVDPTSLADRWSESLTRFKRYVIGFDIKDKARKRALLLYLAGPKVEKIFSTVTDTAEENDYDTAEAKLTAYFAPKKNVLYERHVFRQAKQETEETLDQFYTRLRHLASTCDFTNLEEEIETQLVEKCCSTRLRRKAFRDDSKLDELLQYARALEISSIAVEKHNRSGETVYQTSKHQQQPRNRHLTSATCYNCGEKWPHSDKPWRAIGKTCRSCKKVGHFEKVCRSKSNGRASQIPNRGACKTKQTDPDATRIRALKRQETPINQLQQSEHPQNDKLVSSSSNSSDDDLCSLSNSRREKQPPAAKLKLEKVKVDFLVDTGATANILTAGDFQRICAVTKKRIPLQETKTRIFAPGSSEPVSLEGKLSAIVESKHRVAAATFYVTKDTQGKSSILSYDTSV